VHQAADAGLFAVGLSLVVITIASAVRAMMLPRGVASQISRRVFIATRLVFHLWAGRSASYQRRDGIMAFYAPVALLVLLSTWLLMSVAGFTAMYLGVGVRPLRAAFELSGSAVFTLGTSSSSRLAAAVLTYTEAGIGLLLLTLLITYLPSVYTAFSRRELAVTLLEVRAGSPPSAVELLLRHHRIEKTDRLPELWQQWEFWFVDIEESHTSLPGLPFFRSPQPDHSWVTAGGTILDAAALRISTIEGRRDPDAELMIRAGYLALRRIGAFFRVPFDPDPEPDDPISISRAEYDQACDQLAEAGMKLRPDREATWKAFAGWRVNYDTVLLNLARVTEAPLAPWTSDRSPVHDHMTWTFRAVLSGRYRQRGSRRRLGRGRTPRSERSPSAPAGTGRRR
jgi:hypothetical protein